MKTLHRIFHKNFFKRYFLIVLASCALFTLSFFLPKTMAGFSIFAAVLAPLFTFFINHDLVKNISFLINQHFNRLELLKFFVFSQSLKLILVVLNYCLILGAMSYFIKDSKILGILYSFMPNSYNDYFYLYICIMGVTFYGYMILLAGANRKELLRLNTIQLNTKANNWKNIIIFSTAALVLFVFSEIDSVIKYYIVALVISCIAALLLNRAFKLYQPKKARRVAAFASFIICLPLLVNVYLMRQEVHSPILSYDERVESFLILGSMNIPLSEYEKESFLKEVKTKRNHEELLTILGDDIDFDKSLSLVTKEFQAKSFIDYHSRKMSENDVRKIVAHMSNIMNEQKLNFDFARYSHSFFIEQKINPSYAKDLVNSGDSYKQLAGIYFAKNSLSPKEFLSFYQDNLASLKREVIEDKYISRAIASEKQITK